MSRRWMPRPRRRRRPSQVGRRCPAQASHLAPVPQLPPKSGRPTSRPSSPADCRPARHSRDRRRTHRPKRHLAACTAQTQALPPPQAQTSTGDDEPEPQRRQPQASRIRAGYLHVVAHRRHHLGKAVQPRGVAPRQLKGRLFLSFGSQHSSKSGVSSAAVGRTPRGTIARHSAPLCLHLISTISRVLRQRARILARDATGPSSARPGRPARRAECRRDPRPAAG